MNTSMLAQDLVQLCCSLLALVVGPAARPQRLLQLCRRNLKLSTRSEDIFTAVTTAPRTRKAKVAGRNVCRSLQRES
eukprot:185657-Pleurochrysis_carterae.AAC.2